MAKQSTAKGKKELAQVEVAKINGFSIKTNSLYRVVPKLDMQAPDGFQREGTSKLPSDGIGHISSCGVSRDGSLYDTGFYYGSQCYTGKTKEEQNEMIASLNKHIVVPYEVLSGNKTGILSQSNFEFWDNFKVELWQDRVFNTANINDLLSLYIAVLHFDLTPDGLEGNPRFRGSYFVIKDSEYSLSVSQQRLMAETKASASIWNMWDNDIEKMYFILMSLEIIRLFEKPSRDSVTASLKLWISKDIQNAGILNEAIDKAETEEGYEEIVLYVKVQQGIYKKKIRKEGGDYVFRETPIGKDVRGIVKELQENRDLSEIKEAIRLL